MSYLVASLVISFLLGAVPVSLIAGKMLKGVDLRKCGSGNLGATNVFRNLGPFWGAVILAWDIGKGATAVLLAQMIISFSGNESIIHPDLILLLAAISVVLGHTISPFSGFKGGKGVATSCGACLVLALYPALISLGVFAAVMVFTRVVSLASVSAVSVMPFATLFIQLKTGDHSFTIFLFILALCSLVVFKHRTNLRRLKDGSESKLKAPDKDKGEI
ncbi:glycerol-3-phosphate 1-O-acyltransferase PlsY [bacterium]|jgi:glycerol-3-phosphate acyltransferase PlsY|nr:glycerol-3-phosphate 1-O-acyltransferase PlsY [bacterium]MBT4291974.1 glycerol-3-phosphate 1-O-acyltransferase PlsY [bacterium]MBT7311138.1 glycerol-3-phosphate 1-O-acyltransferase PlsY [bacterium]